MTCVHLLITNLTPYADYVKTGPVGETKESIEWDFLRHGYPCISVSGALKLHVVLVQGRYSV